MMGAWGGAELADIASAASFTSRVHAFLDAHAEPHPVDARGNVIAPDSYAAYTSDGDQADLVRAARAFQRALAEAGLAGLSVPTQYGGQGLDEEHEREYALEASQYALPPTAPMGVALQLVIPTLLAHGSEEQRTRHIPGILCGEELWCQLFSEPEAGSDLASLRTKAVPDADEWVINGQKVWTSFAPYAEFGLLLARTQLGQDGSRHRGITMFAVPMQLPGIEIRPIREMTGGTHFSEVFLEDVRLPATSVIGPEGEGWRVAMTTLGSERASGGQHVPSKAIALVELARRHGRSNDPVVRQELARVWMAEQALRLLSARVTAETDAGKPPAWGGSALKLSHSRLEQSAAALGALIGGPGAAAWEPGNADGGRLAFDLLHSRMWSIAGGTDEIQLNILGERALGLPREPR